MLPLRYAQGFGSCAQHDKAVSAYHTLVGVPSRSPSQERSAM